MGVPVFNTQYVSTPGLAASLQVKNPAGPGRLHRLFVTNTNAAARFCLIFDVAGGLPAEGAVPTFAFNIAPTSTPPGFDFGPEGLHFVNGLWIVNSTTAGTKTIGAADQFFKAIYS